MAAIVTDQHDSVRFEEMSHVGHSPCPFFGMQSREHEDEHDNIERVRLNTLRRFGHSVCSARGQIPNACEALSAGRIGV